MVKSCPLCAWPGTVMRWWQQRFQMTLWNCPVCQCAYISGYRTSRTFKRSISYYSTLQQLENITEEHNVIQILRTFIGDLWLRIGRSYCASSSHRQFVRVLAVGPIETTAGVEEISAEYAWTLHSRKSAGFRCNRIVVHDPLRVCPHPKS